MWSYSSRGTRGSKNRFKIIAPDSEVDPVGLAVLYLEPPIERDYFKRQVVWRGNENVVVVMKSNRFEFDSYCLRVFGFGPGIYNVRPFDDGHKLFEYLFSRSFVHENTKDGVANRIEKFLGTGTIDMDVSERRNPQSF